MIKYDYLIEGRGHNDRTWKTTGHVAIQNEAVLNDVFDIALRDTFLKLTKGQAANCTGPYIIDRILIARNR